MTIFTDSFDGATPDLAWSNTRGGGSVATSGGTAAIGGSDWQFVRAAGDTGSAAMFAEVVVVSGLAGQARRAVVLAGYTTAAATTGYAAIVNGSTQALTILRYNNNGGAPLTSDVPVTVPTGPFTLRIEVDGGAVSASIDGVVLASGTDANPLGGQYGGLGQRDGSAVRFDSYRTGALADEDVPPDPDPEPEPGGGSIAVLGTYSDGAASGGAQNLSVTVPGVADGQGMLAVVTSVYNGDDLTPTGGDANPWQQVGAQLGQNDGEQNQRLGVYTLATSGGTGDRTVTLSTTNESSLTILHLDGPPTVEDVADHVLGRAASPAGQQTIGPVDVPASGGLLVGVWSGVQFGGALVWSPDDPAMTVRQRPATGSYTGTVIATEDVTTGPISRTASATGDPAPDSGYAGKLLVLSGPPEAAPGPVATYAAELTSAPGTATTETFTPEPGEILVVKAVAGHSTITVGPATAPGLAFQEWAASNVINYTTARLSTSRVPPEGVGEIAVSVSYTGSGNVSPTVIVERWQGRTLALTPAMNTARTGPTTTPLQATVQAQGTGSVITWVASDWQPVTTGDAVYESGATETYRRRNSAVNVWSAWQDVAEPGEQIIGMSAPTGQKWTMLGIELLDADAAAGPEPGRFLLAVA